MNLLIWMIYVIPNISLQLYLLPQSTSDLLSETLGAPEHET